MTHLHYFYKGVFFFCIAHILSGCFVIRKHNEDYLQELGTNRSHFDSFIQKVHDETDCFVYITSGYRSNEEQKILYQRNQKKCKARNITTRAFYRHRYQFDLRWGLDCQKRQQRSLGEYTSATNRKRNGISMGGRFQVLS